jgi:heterodisulfide reductase subunit A
MFEAIDYDQQDEELEINVSAIIVSTGFELMDMNQIPDSCYSDKGNVFTAMEVERLYASNGPTQGQIQLRNGEEPKSAAILHCVGREEVGYCSAVCCMNSLKLIFYLKHKLPDIKIYEFYSDMCVPGKSYQDFYEKLKVKAELKRFKAIQLKQDKKEVAITYTALSGKEETIKADMVISSPSIVPPKDSSELAEKLGISEKHKGFFGSESSIRSPVRSGVEGIYLAGCIQGPKDLADSIAQADAAAANILAMT